MERPKFNQEPTEREVTGEIMYLDEARRLNLPAKRYSDIGDMARQMFETEAEMMRAKGLRPQIMDEYERYDNELSDTSASCLAFAKELLEHKDPSSQLSFESFVIDKTPDEVMEALKSIKVGKVLAKDDEQLAIKSNGEYYPVLDIRKKDMQLNSVSFRLSAWSGDKRILTHNEDDQYEYPKDCLTFPSNEPALWYEMSLNFGYLHPDSSLVTEEVRLYSGQRGDLSISSNIWASAYAETGYEGHKGKTLDDITDQDIADFADLLVYVVGVDPETITERNDRRLNEYIGSLSNEVDKLYLKEWKLNLNSNQVLYHLSQITVCNKLLARALKDKKLAKQAHETLANYVDEERAKYNLYANDKEKCKMLFGRELDPWQELVGRQTDN